MGAQNVFQLSMRDDVRAEPPSSIALVPRPSEFVFGCGKTLLIQPKCLVRAEHRQGDDTRRVAYAADCIPRSIRATAPRGQSISTSERPAFSTWRNTSSPCSIITSYFSSKWNAR